MNIADAFRAALKWALLGAVCLAIFVFMLLSRLSADTKAWICIPALVLGIFSFFQSWRSARLFFPGSYLIVAGVTLILFAPALQSIAWGMLLTTIAKVLGPESEYITLGIRPIIDFFEQWSPRGGLSRVDVACFVVGLCLAALGVWYGKEPAIVITVTERGEIETRIGRSATPEQIETAMRETRKGDSEGD